MEERNEIQDLKNKDRRRFMEMSAKFGFTAAVVALGNGFLWNTEAAAQTAKEDQERQKAAKFTMNVATAYIQGNEELVCRYGSSLWTNVLKSVSGFQMYRQYCQPQVEGRRVVPVDERAEGVGIERGHEGLRRRGIGCGAV